MPDDRPSGEPGERLRVTELLAHLLEFHRREEKPVWWRRFDRMEMEENTAQHHEHPFAVGVRYTYSENRTIDLTFLDLLRDIVRRQSLESSLKAIGEVAHILSD